MMVKGYMVTVKDCVFVSPQNSCVETLIFNVMVFGDGAFEK